LTTWQKEAREDPLDGAKSQTASSQSGLDALNNGWRDALLGPSFVLAMN